MTTAKRFVLDMTSVRADLLELAGLRCWETLTLDDGETVGGSEPSWWAFVATASEERIRQSHDAAWDAWVDTTVSPAWTKAARRWFREPVRIR